MTFKEPHWLSLPHFAAIKGAVEKRLGAEIKIIDWTH